MKYLIIGAGGTGGCIGAYRAEAGKDVTLIAREMCIRDSDRSDAAVGVELCFRSVHRLKTE